MDNNLSSVKTINGNEEKERFTETARLLSVLKYLCLAAIIIVAAMLLFVFFSSPIKGALDGVIEKAGIEPLTEAPVAYAWTSPSSSGKSGVEWQSDMTASGSKNNVNSINFRPNLTASDFNGSNNSYAYTGDVDASKGLSTELSGTPKIPILLFWEINFDEVAQEAVSNGQVTKISVSLASTVGSANWINGGQVTGHYFACAGTAVGNGTGLDGMSSVFSSSGGNPYTVKIGNFWSGGSLENMTANFTIEIKSGVQKVRFGIYGYVNKSDSGSQTVVFSLPKVTGFSITSIYGSGNLPQIKFAYGGVGTAGGKINGYNANTVYKANYSSDATYSGGTTLSDVSVDVNFGYFFGGWAMSGGNITNVDYYVSKSIKLSSGAYLCPEEESYGGSNVIVLTAYFYKIDISYTGTKNENGHYTYMQQVENDSLKLDEEGLPSPVAQGPVLPKIKETCPAYNNPGTAFVMYSGTYSTSGSSYTKNGTDYYYGSRDSGHAYSSINMPGDAGTYTFFFGIFISGAANNSENCLGYYYETFTIEGIILSSGKVTGSSIDGAEFIYTGSAITPSLDYLEFTLNGKPYRIHKNDKYGGFDNANNIYNNNVYTFNNTKNPSGITIEASSGNFSGTQRVTFTILPLSVDDTVIDPDLSAEIAERYKTVYTGYTLRPEVILARVVDANDSDNKHVLYAAGTTDKSLKVYYPELSLPENNAITTYTIRKSSNGQAIYYDNTEVSKGKAYFEIDVTGNLEGSIKVYFDIVQLNLNDLDNQFPGADISVTATYEQPETPTYNGYALTPVPTVASITITGIPHYVFSDGVYMNSSYAITYYFVNGTSSGSAVGDYFGNPMFTVWNGYFVDPAASDYTNNTNVTRDASGNVQTGASVTLTLSSDTGSVIGSCTTTFKILPFDLSGTTSGGAANSNFAPIADVTYSGEPLEPAFNFYANGISGSTQKLLDNEEDYGYVYSNNVNVTDSAKVTVTGKNNYTGTVETTFTIKPLNASNAAISDLSATFVYTGSQIAPQKDEIGEITITLNGKEYTLGTDQYEVDAGLGANINASFASDKQNYVMIRLVNNFYSASSLKAYFTISPKNLADITVSQSWASWVNHKDAPAIITYKGSQIANLPIITGMATESENTLYLRDNAAEKRQVLIYGEAGISRDYYVAGWGENVNAGDNAGTVILAGVNNYTGTLELTFKIYARDLSTIASAVNVSLDTSVELGYDSAKQGYYFTGSAITPGVVSVTDTGLAAILAEGDDFSVGYGDNVNVKSGGSVILTGIGNYTGTLTRTFTILPIPQQVTLEDPGADSYNDAVLVPESIATDPSQAIYAQYEFNGSGQSIRLTAYSTAIYPLNAPPAVTFRFMNSKGEPLSLVVSNYNVEIVEINGETLAKTTAIFTNGSTYGVIRVYAVSYDDNKNYEDYDYIAGNTEYRLFAKRADSVDAATFNTSYNYYYGNDNFTIRPGLASYTATKGAFQYSIASSDPEVADVSVTSSGANRDVKIVGAGSATVTISHGGYVGADDTQAYLAFSVTTEINIEKRTLVVSAKPLTVTYGTSISASDFVLTYTTSAKYDSYTGLNYASGHSDLPEEIFGLGGVTVLYNASEMSAVSDTPYSVTVSRLGTVDYGDKAKNYDISYEPTTLTVTKRPATLYVTQNGVNDRLVKVYGSENPTDYTFGVSGTVAGDYSSIESGWQTGEYAKPVIDFMGIGVSTDAGSYIVKITGATAQNYVFDDVEITLIIEQAYVILDLEPVSVDYSGKPHKAGTVTVNGVQNGTVPKGATDAGRLSFDYGYSTGYSYEEPSSAGVYAVRVTFTAEEDDNYKTTVTEFLSALTIERVAPVISYNGVNQIPFSTMGINKNAVAATVSGIEGGTVPLVTRAESYLFRKAGTDEPFAAPTEQNGYYQLSAGIYDVLAIYKANASDNYCDAEVYIYAVFDDEGVLSEGLEIAAGLAEISLVKETKSKVYDGLPVSFTIESDFEDIYYTDPETYVKEKLNKANATVYFQYGDASTGSVNNIPGIHAYVTTVAPTDAGIYTVWVIYDEAGAENKIASRTVTSFVGAVVIERYDLATNGGIKFVPGYQAPQYTYDALTHGVSLDDVAVTGASNGTAPAGYISLRYVMGGAYYDMPVNAGTYTVMAKYTPVANDNYTSSAEWVEIGEGLTINTASVTLEYTRSDAYSFTGESRSITAECLGVTLPNGMREVPKGTLVYEYILNGTYIQGLPVDAGAYNVRVTYKPATNDNYRSAEMTFYNVITISAVKPSIVIQLVSVDFGATIDPASLYTLKGAQFDSKGPVLEYNGIPTVVVSYGTRYTTATGAVDYEWTTEVPTTPGDYSVKVVFTHALNDNNYQDVSATRYDCLKIANAVPTIELESRKAVYSGKAFPANAAKITDANGVVYVKNAGETDDGNYYYGNVNYEYRLSGSSVWTAIAPSAAGSYDVRVTYVPNPVKDVFSAGTQTFTGALVIRELTITVIPVFGQGKTYDGVTEDGEDIAYLYSYESIDADGNTYVYFVYSSLTAADGNGSVDVSKFDYVDENGNVFTVYNGSGKVWRDYYETALKLISGKFVAGSDEYAIDLSAFGASRGEFEYVDPDTGVRYVIDLDSDIVYPAEGAASYAYDIETGYYISSVASDGSVTVINIPKKEIVYTDVEAGLATYTRNEGGRFVVYKLDMQAMTAVSGGVTYRIYEQIGKFAATKNGKTEIISIDFNNMYSVDAASNTGLYKAAGGALYIIDFASASATEVYELEITEVAIGYKDADGNLTYSEAIPVSELVYAGYASEYVRGYTVDTHEVTVYLKARVARVALFYEVKDLGYGVYEINGYPVSKSEMAVTEYKDVYIYDLLYECYYVDFNTMTARREEEMFSMDLASGVIKGTLEGEEILLKVNPEEAEYSVYVNGEITGTTPLYDASYVVGAPALIGNNVWSGSLSMLAGDAGEYVVREGNLNAGSNYKVVFAEETVKYTIGKVKLTVSFTPDPDSYFDGSNKGVEYELEGVLEGDEVRASLTYTGDNYNVSEEGYYVTLSVDSVNYYIENAVSETYYILPAEMSAPVYDEALTSVIYDGARHSVPVTAAADATVYYNGSQSVPYYVEPGTYLITVSVEKRNYVTVTFEIRLTISKSVYTVVPNQVPGTLRYGDALPALTSNSTLGTITLDPGQTLMPGDNTYTWTFTPYDADFYRYYEAADGSGNITGTIVLHVEKAKAEITVNGNLTQSETNPVAITGSINGILDLAGSEGVTVEYIDSEGNRYSTMPTEAGRYTILVTYEGDDLYERTIEYFTLTIEKETNLTWLYYVIGALVLLGGLSTVFFLMRRGKKYE